MNKKYIIILIILIVIIGLVVTFGIYIYSKNERKEKQDHLLKIGNDIVNTVVINNNLDIITNEELNLNEGVIGVLEIPNINLIAPVKNGVSQDILKYAVGHFSNSSNWNGNVCLASHNRGNYVAHYFENIDKLMIGNEIIYKTKFGERRYIVIDNKTIASSDWSVISETIENKITLITCVKNKPNLRICVQAVEK